MIRYISVIEQDASSDPETLRAQYIKVWDEALQVIATARKDTEPLEGLEIVSGPGVAYLINTSLDDLEQKVTDHKTKAAGDETQQNPNLWAQWIKEMSDFANKAAILDHLAVNMASGQDVTQWVQQAATQNLFVVSDPQTVVILHQNATTDWRNALDFVSGVYKQTEEDLDLAGQLEEAAKTAASESNKNNMLSLASQLRKNVGGVKAWISEANKNLANAKAKLDDAANQLHTQGLMGIEDLGILPLLIGIGFILICIGIVIKMLITDVVFPWQDPNVKTRKDSIDQLNKDIKDLEERKLKEPDATKKQEIQAIIDKKQEMLQELVTSVATPPADWVGKAGTFALWVGGIWLFFNLKPWRIVTELMAARGPRAPRREVEADEEEEPIVTKKPKRTILKIRRKQVGAVCR